MSLPETLSFSAEKIRVKNVPAIRSNEHFLLRGKASGKRVAARKKSRRDYENCRDRAITSVIIIRRFDRIRRSGKFDDCADKNVITATTRGETIFLIAAVSAQCYRTIK